MEAAQRSVLGYKPTVPVTISDVSVRAGRKEATLLLSAVGLGSSMITVEATDASATEGADTATFTFSRTGVPTAALTVLVTTGGTATLSPAAARWVPEVGEYILDWDDVVAAPDPFAAAFAFARSALDHGCAVCEWDPVLAGSLTGSPPPVR